MASITDKPRCHAVCAGQRRGCAGDRCVDDEIDMDSLNEISLREATDADVPTMVGLIHAAFKEYAGALDPPSGAHKETVENLREKLTGERAVLALLGGQAVGCVFYTDEGDQMYF